MGGVGEQRNPLTGKLSIRMMIFGSKSMGVFRSRNLMVPFVLTYDLDLSMS